MKVRQVMSREVSVCGQEASLSEAAVLMWSRDIGFLPVVDGERRLIGIVTDRDACMAAYTRGQPLSAIRVDLAMAKKVHVCHEEDAARLCMP